MGNISNAVKRMMQQKKTEEKAVLSYPQFLSKSMSEYNQINENCIFQTHTWRTNPHSRFKVQSCNLNEMDEHVQLYFQKLKNIGNVIDQNNVYLPVMVLRQSKQCQCTDSGSDSIKFYNEIYDIKMEDELIIRDKYKQTFSQPQIWYILYSLVNACQQFESFCEPSGNITIKSIVLNQNGHIKLINQLSSYLVPDNNTPKNYYSIEEMSIMRDYFDQEITFNHQIYKHFRIHPNVCQTYSIAMVILELATFVNAKHYYNMERMSFHSKLIDRSLQIMAERGYSKLLQNLMKVMLSSHKDRPLPSQIYSIFRKYERNILRLQPFSIQPGDQSMNQSGFYYG